MVCILSGREHLFEFVNEAHIAALGFDATGQTVRQAQPESVEVHGILDQVYATGITAELREIPITLTDRVRYFNLTYAARRDDKEQIDGIMIMGSEVTDQVLARLSQEEYRRSLEEVHRKLAKSEEQLSLALRTSRVGFYDWDIQKDVIVLSPQMLADWGLPDDYAENTLGGFMMNIHEADRDRVSAAIKRSLTYNEPYHVEYRVRRPDGSVSMMEVRGHVQHAPDGTPLRFFGTSVDISARFESERNLRALADSMPQVVWTARPDGVTDYTNLRWTEYSGSTDSARWLDFVAPEDRKNAIDSWSAAVKSASTYEAEFRLLRQHDQAFRRHLVRAIPAFDEAGNVAHWFGTCTDIEDQKRGEDALRAASAAKTDFLANMSHEVRTPLGAILGFIELVRIPETSRAQIDKYLAIIERNSRHLLRIVDDILDISKVEAGQMLLEQVELSLPTLLADVDSVLGMRARERGVDFRLRTASPLPTLLKSDPTRLRQILINLAGNAVKFTEKGEIMIELTHNEPFLTIRVSDTGIGISADDKQHLFEAFTQGDASVTRRFGGTGLGLALTRQLCRLLGGDLQLVQSEVGTGSIFEATVRVEVSPLAEFVSEGLMSRVTPIPSSLDVNRALLGMRVLVVEDSVDNQTLLRVLLSKAGAEVELAEDGAAGVEATLHNDFDVVLMDVQMPRMDGHSAAKALRARGYTQPLIALTAHAMKGEREKAFEAGFSAFLAKPFSRDALLAAVRDVTRPTTAAFLIVEDDEDMRELLTELLQREGFVCSSVGSTEDALLVIDELPRPLVILTDVSLPGASGEDFAVMLQSRPDRKRLHVVLMSGWDDLSSRAQAHSADGSLRKPFQVTELLAELKRAIQSGLA